MHPKAAYPFDWMSLLQLNLVIHTATKYQLPSDPGEMLLMALLAFITDIADILCGTYLRTAISVYECYLTGVFFSENKAFGIKYKILPLGTFKGRDLENVNAVGILLSWFYNDYTGLD